MPEDRKPLFDLKDITGKWPLLGAFLLVVEVVLAYWLTVAQSSSERLYAGTLMAVILLTFLFVVIKIAAQKDTTSAQGIVPPEVGTVTPAKTEVSAQEVEEPPVESLGSPTGTYLVNRPPADWSIRVLSIEEWLAVNMQTDVSDAAPEQNVERDILELRSGRVTSIVPIPGKTLIDKRAIPTALETKVPTSLSIIPLPRAHAPFFVERPFVHNAALNLFENLKIGVMTLHHLEQGELRGTKRKYWSAQLRQDLENVIVNGVPTEKASAHFFLLVIEGDLIDHALLMRYAAHSAADPELDEDLKTLNDLVSSFRPLRSSDEDAIRKTQSEKNEAAFKQTIIDSGHNMFMTEIGLAIMRVRNLDLDDPKERMEAINLLRPFEQLAKLVNIEDADLTDLWESIHQADRGNALPFVTVVQRAIEEGTSEDDPKLLE